MIPRIPPPIIAAVLSFSLLMMVFVGTLTRRGSPQLVVPSWSNTAIVALALYAAFVIAYMLFMRKQLAGRMGDRLRAQRTHPTVFLGFSGTVMFFSPAAVALFLVLAGIPLMYLYLATAFSIVGMIAWSAGYRSYKR